MLLLILSVKLFPQDKPVVESYLDGAMISGITGDEKDLWVSTYGRGIYRYSISENKWTNFSTSKGNLQQDFFYCITFNKDFVWAGSSDGLFTYDRKNDVWRKRKFGLGGELGNWIRSICYDKYADVVWIGRFKYLTKFDITKNRFTDHDLTINGDVKTNNIKSIKLDGDSLVWFGTEAGIHKFNKAKDIEDKSGLEFYSSRNDYFNGDGDVVSIADVIFEKNNIWFGLDEFITEQKPNFNIGGLYRFNRRALWDRLDRTYGLAANGIFCLEKTGNLIWASLYQFDKKSKEQLGEGIALINKNNLSVKMISKDELELRSDKILCMYFDGENMWLGSETGLLKVKITNQLASFKTKPLKKN
ncbi:MAG: hypothetical protein C4539_13585 [Ignavibacteriales bacterium]|nr:MAG: hypothetical protein C4539_13585 [Ignavibacteriales bacterium]